MKVTKSRVAVAFGFLLGLAAFTAEAQVSIPEMPTLGAFFSTVVAGGIKDGTIYLQLPLSGDTSRSREQRNAAREAFFKSAVPQIEKWNQTENQRAGYQGDVVPEQYLDLRYIETSTPYRIGQTLIVRTSKGMLPVQIAKYEIERDLASGNMYFYGIGEPAGGASRPRVKEVIVAAPRLPDCGRSCSLSKVKPSDDRADRVRAVAVQQLGVAFPSDIPPEARTEEFTVYEGRFTRKDSAQYVAFFSRHRKDEPPDGKWAAYVVDSDFSLIAVLGRDDYLQIIPDGVADVNGDGLDEIWCNELGYEGMAYSLWYLADSRAPFSFSALRWDYLGL